MESSMERRDPVDRSLTATLDESDHSVPKATTTLNPLGLLRGRPVKLASALEILQAADREHVDLRLWGSMAVEFQSPSFRRLGFHEEHWDMDFAARPGQRSVVLNLFNSLGFHNGKVVYRGLNGAGWIFLKNDLGELVEVCLTHALDEGMLREDAVTVPLWLIAMRLLADPITSQTIYRADDTIAFLLDHDVGSVTSEEQWNKMPLAALVNEDIMDTLVRENISLIKYRLETLDLHIEAETILERVTPIETAIFSASRRTLTQQVRMLERWGFAPGQFVDDYSAEKWQALVDPTADIWYTYREGDRGKLELVKS